MWPHSATTNDSVEVVFCSSGSGQVFRGADGGVVMPDGSMQLINDHVPVAWQHGLFIIPYIARWSP